MEKKKEASTNYNIKPGSWKVEKLINLSLDGINNGTFNDPKKVGKGVKLINVVDLYNEPKINTNNLSLLDVPSSTVEKYKVEEGDLFFTRSSLKVSGIAKCNINEDKESTMVYDGHIMRVRPNIEKVVPKFLKEYCQINQARKYVMRHSKTTTMTTIGQKDLGEMPVLLPSIQEQQKIADILSTWDKEIELQERLIEQKQMQKKSLMQNLLSGQVRLNGFEGKWEKKKIGDCVAESKEIANTPDLNKKVTVKLNLGGVKKREVNPVEKEGATTQYIRKAGQFIYGKQNLHKGALGLIPPELDGYQTSSDIPAFDFKEEVFHEWFFYYMSQSYIYSNLEKISTGTGSKRINPKDLLAVKLKLPAFKEQYAIAKVLRKADREINLLERELKLLKQQKKGLMQKLLTGEVRVNV